MSFRRSALAVMTFSVVAQVALAQSPDETSGKIVMELNALQDVNGACRMTFLVQNETGTEIDQAVYETVIFGADGGVVSLSLFDFRNLPADRPRVRQFELSEMQCDSIGRALINGANSCVVGGSQNTLCDTALRLESRLSVELLG